MGGKRKFNFKQKLPMQSNLQLSVYDINKMAYAQLPTLEPNSPEWNDAFYTVELYTGALTQNYYFMLLNNELHYYTIFHINSNAQDDTIVSALEDCIKSIGQLINIEHNEETNALECWIKKDNEAYMFPFFPYDEGVIECHQ